MSPAERNAEADRRLQRAYRMQDVAGEHYAIADECMREALRLCREARALTEGRDLAPRPRRVLPDLRH